MCAGSDFATEGLQFCGKPQPPLLHASSNELVAFRLQHARKKPADLSPGGIIGRVSDEWSECPKQALRLLGLERLVAPRAHALEAESIAIEPARRTLHPVHRG